MLDEPVNAPEFQRLVDRAERVRCSCSFSGSATTMAVRRLARTSTSIPTTSIPATSPPRSAASRRS
jgi:glutamate-1-semialdehyde aminotransferase